MKGKVQMIPRVDSLSAGYILISKTPIGEYVLSKTTGIYDVKAGWAICEDYYDSGSSWGTQISEHRDLVVISKELEYPVLLAYREYASALKRRLMWNNKTIEFKLVYPEAISDEHPCKNSLDKFRDRLKMAVIVRSKMYSQKQVDAMLNHLPQPPKIEKKI